jgi:hypothetical protein
MDQLPADRRRALWHQRRGEYDKAALVWEEAEAWPEAASAYERAGDTSNALALYKRIEHWVQMIEIIRSNKSGTRDHTEMLAEALENSAQGEDDFKAAMEAYAKAAETYALSSLTSEDDEAERHLARLYERAAKCAEQAYEWNQVSEYLRRVAKYRHLPRLELRLLPNPAAKFTAGYHSQITFEIHNIGYGIARNISLTLSGAVTEQTTDPIPGIRPDQKVRRDINIYFPDQIEGRTNAGQLELIITIRYTLPDEQLHTSRHSIIVNVTERPDGSQTIMYNIDGDLIHTQEMIKGQQYRAPVGDRVNIVRHAAGGDRSATSVGAQVPDRCPNSTCGFNFGEGHDYEFCPACGTSLRSSYEVS